MKKQLAFTLMELLMALAIAGVLVAMGMTFRGESLGWASSMNAGYRQMERLVDLARSEAVRQRQSVFMELVQPTNADGAPTGEISWQLFTMQPPGTPATTLNARVLLKVAELDFPGLSFACVLPANGANMNNPPLCELFEFNALGRLEGGAQRVIVCVPTSQVNANGEIVESGLEGDLSLLGRLSEGRAVQC